MVQKLEEGAEKEKAKQVLNQVTGRTDFLGDIEKEQIKTKFSDSLKSITEDLTEDQVKNQLINGDNKETTNKYFEKFSDEKEYKHKIGGSTFTITKK
jgi:hypothetical protein